MSETNAEAVGPYAPRKFEHFLSRLSERYGITLTQDEVETLLKELEAGKHVLRARDPFGKTVNHYYVPIKGQLVSVAFDTETKYLVTAAPRGRLKSSAMRDFSNRAIAEAERLRRTKPGFRIKEHRQVRDKQDID